MIKLIASQLEGLLSKQTEKLDLSALQRHLKRMKQHGTQLVLFTRSSYPYLLHKFQSVEGPLDYVAENGAEVVINGVNVREHQFDAIVLSQILDWLDRQPNFEDATITLSSKTNTITNAKLQDSIYAKLKKSYPTMTPAPDLLMIANHIYQIRIDVAAGKMPKCQKELEKKFKDQIRLVPGGQDYFYLVTPEATFANGLATIQKHGGIRNRQTAAFGNLAKDFGFMNAAKYSYATPDAPADVKNVSQSLKGSNPQSVIFEKFDQLMKQK